MTTKMTAQDVANRQTDAWNRHDSAAFAAGYAENASVHDPVYPEPLLGRAAIEKDAADFITAFPDVHIQITRVISDGGLLVYEGTVSGTHLGPLPLPTGVVPATSRRVGFPIAGFAELNEAGLIQDERRYYDVAGQLVQLGLMQ